MKIQIFLILVIFYISKVYCRDTTIKFKYASLTYKETDEVQIIGINNGTINYLIIKEEDNDSEGIFRLGVMEKYKDYCKTLCKLFVKPLKNTAVISREVIGFLEVFNSGNNSLIKYTGTESITSGCVYNKTIEIKNSDSPSTLPIDGLFYSPNIGNSQILNHFNDTAIQFDAIYEKTPLARAEWIKFVSVFYGLESNATRIFEQIEETYECNRLKIENNKDLFTRMRVAWLKSSYPKENLWEMTDANYKINLLNDAGADVVTIKETTMENLHNKLKNAHFLINDTPTDKNNDGMDEFYKQYDYTEDSDLLLLKEKNLLKNDGFRSTDDISSWDEDYMIYPHLVLVDLIHWFHPKLGNLPLYGFDNGKNGTEGIWFRNIAERSTIHMTSNLDCPTKLPNILSEKVCINVDSFEGDYSDYAKFDDGLTQLKNYFKIYWYIVFLIVFFAILVIGLIFMVKRYRIKKDNRNRPTSNKVENHNFYMMED